MAFGKWAWGSGNGLWLANGPSAHNSGRSTRLTVEGWSFFTFSRDAGRKTVLASSEASLKRGGSCGVRERALVSLPLSASQGSPPSAQRSPPSPKKGTVLKRTTVQFVNGLRPSNKRPVRQRCVCVYVRARVCVCVCQCDRYWTAIVLDSNGYWGALPGPNLNVREALNGQQCNKMLS